MDCLQSQGHRYLLGWRAGIARTLWWDGTDLPWLPLGLVSTGWNRTLVFKFFVSLCGEFFPSLHTQRKKHWPHLQGKCNLKQYLHSRSYFLIWCNFSYFGEGCWVGGKYDVFVTYSSHYLWNLTIKEWYNSCAMKVIKVKEDGEN